MPRPSHAPWSARAEFAATTAFWVLLTGLLLVRRAMGPLGFVALSPSGVVGTVAEYAVWIALTPVVFALARRFPLERGRVWRRLAALLAVGFGLAAAIELGRSVLLHRPRGPRRARPAPPRTRGAGPSGPERL